MDLKYSNPRMTAVIPDWPSGSKRVTARFEIEQDAKLTEYHAIQAVKSDMRIRDRYIRFASIKASLKNYRVMVNYTGDDKARIFNPESKAEVIL